MIREEVNAIAWGAATLMLVAVVFLFAWLDREQQRAIDRSLPPRVLDEKWKSTVREELGITDLEQRVTELEK